MSDVTRLLEAAQNGDPQAAADLLPLVYEELRKLASAKMAHEKPGQTLDATALVHEAYLRLVGDQKFDNRRHFFAAAAEAMRRILVDNARRKARLKHGGDRVQVSFPDDFPAPSVPLEDVLAVDESLESLAELEPITAELVKLRYFAGLTLEQAADLLEIPHRTAYRYWTFARAWLFRQLGGSESQE